jgi:hypothetical protein
MPEIGTHAAVRWAGWSALGLAGGWAVASLTTGMAIGFSIRQPESLLFALAHHRNLFIFSNASMIATQLLVAPLVLGLIVVLRPSLTRPMIVLGLVALSASSLLFIMSASCHAVYGTVPARAFAANGGVGRTDIILSSDVLHHVADFFYFLGVAVTALGLALLAPALRASGAFGHAVAGLAVATAVAHTLQFAWLVRLTAMENFGIIGIVLQISLFGLIGMHLVRAAPRFGEAPQFGAP